MNQVLACYINCKVSSVSQVRKLWYFLLAFRNLLQFFATLHSGCALEAVFRGFI